MTLIDLLILLIVAGIAGSIGQALAGNARSGCISSIILGFIGALIGMWLARELDLPVLLTISVGGSTFPIIWSIIGSALFVAVLAFIRRSSR